MSHRPYTVDDLPAFDAVLDARSPAEYALDHVPGAVSCPVLDDEQRRLVGTTYVQVSPFEARKIGGALVARNIARHLEERFAHQPASWRPLVYCWRGGMRSGSFVTVLRAVGWDAQQLKGGYKAWRHHVVDRLPAVVAGLRFRVLGGATGSAKTRVLQALTERGEQVLDLEGLARHKGSVLGDVPGQPQPSQKGFETQLFARLAAFDPARPVWVEAESKKVGRVAVPDALMAAMHASPLVEIEASMPARVAFLLRDYTWFAEDPAALSARLGGLRGVVPNAELAQWQAWAAAGDLAPLLAALLARHYDPLYARGMGHHWALRDERRRVATDDLSEAGIAQLAQAIAALG